ncbi:MAG: cell division protein ZapE [Acidiphilium sp.]|nr:cell division protein ZapE [Acidiphilium sp.]MDD4934460.1 cell division protein ZapE [Acidiphilium sp.]
MLDQVKGRSAGDVMSAYRVRIDAGTILPDPVQRRAAERLHELWGRLRGYDPHPKAPPNGWFGRLLNKKRVDEVPEDYPSGLYLVGEVGRGKSMLMDMFFDTAQVPRKRRVHFHEFMQQTHARLHRLRTEDPESDAIAGLADVIAEESALLCFDEFQIHDIGDAMILAKLFEALFARAVVVVATSNTLPDNLYKDKPGYESFRPFIALLKRHLDVLVLDGGTDYRLERVRGARNWYVPADVRAERALDDVFARLTDGAEPKPEILTVFGRKLRVPYAANGVARFDFAALCAEALGSGDYLALATHYDTVLIDAIPALSPENFDEARRFITLVDALYEHHVKLYASAAAEPAALYTSGEGASIFERTVSRLEEMRSEAYFALRHLT